MENRDSGVADVDVDHQPCLDHVHQMHGYIVSSVAVPPPPSCPAPAAPRLSQNPPPTNIIKRYVLSNSLVDINDPVALAAERLQRRGSVGSLDSGMSVSFQHQQGSRTALHRPEQRSPGRLFGGIFPGRQRKLSASGVPDSKGALGKSTEV
ncbi:unnamed protein product [Plutella xylostella]|uniref:(diamondback moth) hypothetical protein n=1 Tax=Plutella xylostella TaxID=51655 RepID=A0A8S4E4D8_PLUXY|nr:unnamed protein product [Plutella xylostella]